MRRIPVHAVVARTIKRKASIHRAWGDGKLCVLINNTRIIPQSSQRSSRIAVNQEVEQCTGLSPPCNPLFAHRRAVVCMIIACVYDCQLPVYYTVYIMHHLCVVCVCFRDSVGFIWGLRCSLSKSCQHRCSLKCPPELGQVLYNCMDSWDYLLKYMPWRKLEPNLSNQWDEAIILQNFTDFWKVCMLMRLNS